MILPIPSDPVPVFSQEQPLSRKQIERAKHPPNNPEMNRFIMLTMQTFLPDWEIPTCRLIIPEVPISIRNSPIHSSIHPSIPPMQTAWLYAPDTSLNPPKTSKKGNTLEPRVLLFSAPFDERSATTFLKQTKQSFLQAPQFNALSQLANPGKVAQPHTRHSHSSL